VVAIKMREMEPKSAEVTTEWGIVPGSEGRPTLVIYYSFFCYLQFLLIILYNTCDILNSESIRLTCMYIHASIGNVF
jgi:hypothetical protein